MNKYSPYRLPPKKFDHDYIVSRGYRVEQLVKIALHPRNKKEVIYFKVILRRLYSDRWYNVITFDTFHKGEVYLHAHRTHGLTKKMLLVGGVPKETNLKKARVWVEKHLNKHWRDYVSMNIVDIRNDKK